MQIWLALLLAVAQRFGFATQAHRQGPSASTAQVVVGPAQEYLIPYDASVVGQWNASDLANGAAKVGPAWTRNGTVAFTPAKGVTPPSVGPFTSDSNYYSLPAANPLNVITPFTSVLVINMLSSAASQILFAVGPANTSGWYLQMDSMHDYFTISSPTLEQLQVSGTPGLGVNMLFGGWDGSKIWFQLNGGAARSQAAAGAPALSATSTFLGRYTSTGFAFGNGTIIEVQVRRQAPSAALFTAIYQAVEANL